MSDLRKTRTFTASIPRDRVELYDWIADADHLPRWHGAAWGALSRHGSVRVRFVRGDHACVLDLYWKTAAGAECVEAVRVLANGAGSEVVLSVVQTEGLSDHDFDQHARWAERALQELKHQGDRGRKSSTPVETTQVASTETVPTASEPPAAVSHKRLYIGNLPFDWTEEHLKLHFGVVGTVAIAEVARYGRNGRSRGFGFVEMSTEEENCVAIEQLHGSLAGNRKIVVRASRVRENREGQPAPAEAEPATAEPAPLSETAEAPTSAPDHHHEPKKPAHAPNSLRRRLREFGTRLTRRQEREQRAGVIATGEYEFFPRGHKAEPAAAPSEPEAAPRPVVEPSPYMEDTGDVENRGSRHPRRRPPPRRVRRPSRRS